MARLALVLALALVACRREAVPPPGPCSAGAATGPFGVAAIDGLFVADGEGRWALRADDDPALFAGLERAWAAPVSELPVAVRVLVQNELWGLRQRLEARGDPDPARLGRLAAWVARLAPEPWELERSEADLAAVVGGLAPGEPWALRSSELPVMSHEAAYGLRRIFHVLVRDGLDGRALVQTLVAVDRRGAARATAIVGGVELVESDGARATVAVYERSLAGAGCGHGPALVRLHEVSAVPPARDLTRPIAEFPPARVEPALCARCHRGEALRPPADEPLFSLPLDESPARRVGALLAQIEGTVPWARTASCPPAAAVAALHAAAFRLERGDRAGGEVELGRARASLGGLGDPRAAELAALVGAGDTERARLLFSDWTCLPEATHRALHEALGAPTAR